MVSYVGHYADHDFTAHAHHSWTPRSGFVQPLLWVVIDTDVSGPARAAWSREGIPFLVQRVHDSRRNNSTLSVVQVATLLPKKS